MRRFWSEWKQALIIVGPETVVRWHRIGVRNVLASNFQRPPDSRPGKDKQEKLEDAKIEKSEKPVAHGVTMAKTYVG